MRVSLKFLSDLKILRPKSGVGKLTKSGPAFWEICMQSKKQQLEMDMEQQICSKLEKEYIKTIYIVTLLI